MPSQNPFAHVEAQIREFFEGATESDDRLPEAVADDLKVRLRDYFAPIPSYQTGDLVVQNPLLLAYDLPEHQPMIVVHPPWETDPRVGAELSDRGQPFAMMMVGYIDAGGDFGIINVDAARFLPYEPPHGGE